MYEVKAYHCSFCKKHGLTKSNIARHERECFRNPDTRSCATCANYAQRNESERIVSDFPFDCTPICLENISLLDNNFMLDVPKIKLKTNCAKWLERPEDEVELAKYQAEKQGWELIELDPENFI